MSENLNPNEPWTLETRLECPLMNLTRLRRLFVSNSAWEEVFIHVQQEVSAMAQTPSWAAST